MKVGINCLTINPSYTGGIKTFTYGLLDGFTRHTSKARFTIYATEQNRHLFDRYANQPGFSIRVVSHYDSRFKRFLLWRLAMMKARKAYKLTADFFYYKIAVVLSEENDVVYFPNTVINPYCYTKPTVLSMHDIQQVHFPEFFDEQQLKDRYVTYHLSAANVTCMQASSEFIRQDFLDNFPSLEPRQVEVINEGVNLDEFRAPHDVAPILYKYAIPPRFLFFPAQLWLHKNHLTVLKALLELHQQGITIPLVLTGAQYSAAELIFRFIKENNMPYVHYLGKVPFEDLVALYQSARFMITAVLYESSSLPVLEAAAAGTAIIASNTPPNVELSRKLLINLFDPYSPQNLADLLKNIWNHDELQASQKAYNREQIVQFGWDQIAGKYVDLFQRIIDNHS